MSDLAAGAATVGTILNTLVHPGTGLAGRIQGQQWNLASTLMPQELQQAYQNSVYGTNLYNYYAQTVLPALLGYYGQLGGLPNSIASLFSGASSIGGLSLPQTPYIPPDTLHANKANSPQDKANLLQQIQNLNSYLQQFLQKNPDANVPGTPNYQIAQKMQQQLWSLSAAYGINKLGQNVSSGFYAPVQSQGAAGGAGDAVRNRGVRNPSPQWNAQNAPGAAAPMSNTDQTPFQLTPWEQQQLTAQFDMLNKSAQQALANYRARAAQMGITDSSALAAGESMIMQTLGVLSQQAQSQYLQDAMQRRMQAVSGLLSQAASQEQLGLGLAAQLPGVESDVISQALGIGGQAGQMAALNMQQSAEQLSGIGSLLGYAASQFGQRNNDNQMNQLLKYLSTPTTVNTPTSNYIPIDPGLNKLFGDIMAVSGG